VIHRLLCSLLLAVTVLAGCHTNRKPSPADGSAQNLPAQNIKVYRLRGKVVSTDPAHRQVTLDHEAIPGFMDAMTMPYRLKDETILSELHPGDVITSDLLVPPDPNAEVELDHIVVIAQGQPDYRPAVTYHVPVQGDSVPDFKLRNQDGRPLRTAQFKGDALLVTFIYTRCPLPDFCPRVTRYFAQVNRDLQATPAVYAKTHLLCVSFDPDHDTPERLRAYGSTYLGSDSGDAFRHIDFAVPDPQVLKRMAQYFDVGVTTGPDQSITHTLSTTLIGPDGKVVKFYPGNEWTPGQLEADVRARLAEVAH
jgi:protein SCO1/2